MRRHSVSPLWGALLALGVSAAVAGAQSLGELAAKEQERREKERQKHGGPSKVITERDLGGTGKGTVSNAGAEGLNPSPAPGEAAKAEQKGDAAKPAAATQAKEKTPDEVREEEQNAWRQRLEAARKEVTDLTERVDRLQQSLNDLTGSYSSGRAAVLTQWETAKKDLAAAQQKVADLQEEGRRKSFR